MSTARIRDATIEDFDGILLLLHQLWSNKELNESILKNVFTHAVDSHSEEYFCAEINGAIVGFCSMLIKNSLWQEGYIGYINELVVDESVRGRGIGTDLVQKAIDIDQKRGCKRIELDTAFNRTEVHKFYVRIGFEKRAYLFSKEL